MQHTASEYAFPHHQITKKNKKGGKLAKLTSFRADNETASLLGFEVAIGASLDSSSPECKTAAFDGTDFGRNRLPVLETLNEIPMAVGISTN